MDEQRKTKAVRKEEAAIRKKEAAVRKEEAAIRKKLKSAAKQEILQKRNELSEYADNKKYETEFSFDILVEALCMEHKTAQTSLRRFTLEDIKIIAVASDEYYYSYAGEYIPPGLDYLSIVLVAQEDEEGRTITGTTKYVNTINSSIYFTTDIDLNTDQLYTIAYETNRYQLDACLHAIGLIKQYELLNYFTTFDDESIAMAPKRNIKGPSIKIPKVKKKSNKPSEWFNQNVFQDIQQRDTVLKILSESAYPYPFVITGGTGTGKTCVLVETVTQIVHKKDRARILITSQSNSACDEIGIRLLNFLPSVKVFRHYAYHYFKTRFTDRFTKDPRNKNYNKDNYFERLSQNSTINAHDRTYHSPTVENFVKFKIVIATMTTIHHLKRRYGLAGHFDFIFVDECCAAIEPECLIPIVEFGMSHRKVLSNIILIGDDKLLGPQLNNRLAKNLGLEQSFLERILRLDLYKPEDTSKRIVRLINNYRSHPEIFKFSNMEFYDGSMVSMISTDEYNFATNWKQLPNSDIPIIFHAVKFESVAEADGKSLFNSSEINKVVEYVENLIKFGFSSTRQVKQEQIGIVTPYTAQVKKLRERLGKYPKIDVGTTEFFQGREKPIMIISAVRTEALKDCSNFLDNPRRINVLLTRAKSLMIIVGNLEKLSKFQSWQPFIRHCLLNGLARKGALHDADDGEDVLIERLQFSMRINESSTESESDENDEDESSSVE